MAAVSEHGESLDVEERREARYLLWRATADRTHLADAKRLLDESLSTVPEEFHRSMLENRRIHREITAAWESESTDDESIDDDPPRTEPATRVG